MNVIRKEAAANTERRGEPLPLRIARFLLSTDYRLTVYCRKMASMKCGSMIRRLLSERVYSRYGLKLSPYAQIGKRLTVRHYPGIVIGAGVTVGSDCIIYQGVTLGQSKGRYPTIEDGCILYANSMVAGGVTVGANSVIGAGCFVNHDIPERTLVSCDPCATRQHDLRSTDFEKMRNL